MEQRLDTIVDDWLGHISDLEFLFLAPVSAFYGASDCRDTSWLDLAYPAVLNSTKMDVNTATGLDTNGLVS